MSSQTTPRLAASKLLAQGRQAESKGDLQQALGDYTAARNMDPADAQTSLRIGLLFGRSLNFAEAETAFRRAINIDPQCAEAHYNLGLTLVAKSQNPDWNGALAEFRAAVKVKPAYAGAGNMEGVGLLETGQPALAVSTLRSALLLAPDSAETHFNLGRALEASGDQAQAYPEYLKAIQVKPVYPDAEIAVASILLARRDYTPAISRLHAALAANPDSERAHFLLGAILRAQGRVDDAAVELKLSAQPEQRQSDAMRASHLSNEALDLARQGHFAEAVASARQAIDLAPGYAIAHFNLALLLADSGEMQAAILEAREAISLAPTRASFYASLARMQLKIEDRPGAVESLRHALQLDPQNVLVGKELSSLQENVAAPPDELAAFPYGAARDTAADHFAFATHLASQGNLRGASGELLHALSLEPARSDIRYNLAVAYTGLGEYEKAELELRKVLLVNGDSIDAHIALGTLLLQKKDLASAASEFRSVLALEPGNRQAPQLLSQCLNAAKP